MKVTRKTFYFISILYFIKFLVYIKKLYQLILHLATPTTAH